jgi:uncharacterized protein YqfA (UPF0365 family)
MARPTKKTEVLRAVRAYLRSAEARPATEAPITYIAVAEEIGADWRTVKKWAEPDIESAKKRQRRASLSATRQEEEAYADRLRAKDDEIKRLKGENRALLARIILMEGNAQRLGIDPDEYYRPLTKPNRTVSRAGSGGRRR